MRRIRRLLLPAFFVSLFPLVCDAVLTIDASATTPVVGDSGDGWTLVDFGYENLQPKTLVDSIESTYGTTEMYRAEAPEEDGVAAPEDKELADSYTTVFSNTSTDPANATITFDGGPTYDAVSFIDPYATNHVLVKDGSSSPAWYLFEIEWDGRSDIELLSFWPDQGSISFVSLLSSGEAVPEPKSIAIWSTMLVSALCVFACRRRRQSN